MVAERVIQQLRLVEPGGMDRRETGSPPGVLLEILMGCGGGMAGVTVLDQKDTPQMMMALLKPAQGLNVVLGVFTRRAGGFHATTMDYEKQQRVDGAMTTVLKLLLLDRAGNGAADGLTLKRLQIGHLITADEPNAVMNQALGVSVTPEYLLRAIFKLCVQARRFPIPRAMRLQIHLMQEAPNRARADLRDNAVSDRLTRQILAGPVGDMQPLSNRLQTRQLHNLGALQGGKFAVTALREGTLRTTVPDRLAHNSDTSARRYSDGIADVQRLPGYAHQQLPLTPCGHAGPETRATFGFALPVPARVHLRGQL
jgi:hypothetical protein